MAYNPEARRGLYRKTRGRAKAVAPKPKAQPNIGHHGLMPYLVRFSEWGGVTGLSPSTIKTRELALKRFIVWCDERGLDQPDQITRPDLERYQTYLYHYRKRDNTPLSPGSQHSLLAPIRAFFKWLTRQNILLHNPASELDLPKQLRGLPQAILSVEEVERLLALPDITSPYGIRDRAILETLYSTGIRRMELVNLTRYDVDLSRQTLMVRKGKGGKDRCLPLGQRATHWLTCYSQEVRDQLVFDEEEPALFLTDYGEAWKRNRLSDFIKKYLHHAEIDKPGGCHLFRHAMATHMLENGADIRFIQAMLGHADLSTTQIYTQVSMEKLRQVHGATHPAEQAC